MNKRDLVEELKLATRLTKSDLERTINAMLDIIQKRVGAGEDVTLSGFGTFTVMKRKARKGYNPHTGTSLELPELTLPKFRPGKDFRKALGPLSS